MHVTIQSGALARALKTMGPVIRQRPTIPILCSVLLEADGEALIISATDTALGIRTLIDAADVTVKTQGRVAIPAMRLYEIARALPDAGIVLEAKGTTTQVRSAGYTAKLLGYAPEDFPILAQPTSRRASISATVVWQGLPLAGFGRLIRLTSFATTRDDTRYFLNGARFELETGRMRLVAMDGYRLAMASGACDYAGEREAVMIPVEALDVLMDLASRASVGDVIRYVRAENHLFFEAGATRLMTRLLNGEFPAYERVIPAQYDHRVEIGRVALIEALRQVAIVLSGVSCCVKLGLESGLVVVSGVSAEAGEAKAELPVNYSGPALSIGVDARYAIDVLEAGDAEHVALEAINAEKPMVWRFVGDEENYLCVIMPMRL